MAGKQERLTPRPLAHRPLKAAGDPAAAGTGGKDRSARAARPAAASARSRRLTPELRQRAGRIAAGLALLYPDAFCALKHRNPFELLVATILSAQCTDARVNLVTPALFARFPDARAFAAAELPEIEALIRSTGFYRNKAKSILGASRLIVERFGGQVPRTMDELLQLPGVARKTANVVLGNAYGRNVGFVVDTHIGRLGRRLGLTRHTDPVKVEQDLMAVFPDENWTMLAHRLIFHGRQICDARKPRCQACALAGDCPRVGVKREG